MGKYLTKFGLEQIPRCTLLDPVCEGWHPKCGNLEAKGNYGYVDVIHTTAGTLGMLEPIGDIDFYPDGGTIQKCTCASPCEGVNCNKNGGQKNSHARAQSLYEVSRNMSFMIAIIVVVFIVVIVSTIIYYIIVDEN